MSVHFSLGGRPRGRGFNSIFDRSAICSVHSGAPNGRPLQETRCQFISPWEAGPGGGGLTRSSIAQPFVRSIREPRTVGRSRASRVRSSTRTHLARRTPWLAIASDVARRSFPVPPTQGRGSVRGRLVPNHGRGRSTIDTRRGRLPSWREVGWPRCIADPLAGVRHPESPGS